MMELGFLSKKNILASLKQKAIFPLMCFVAKTSWFFQSTFQIKNLKIRWICWLYLMKTSQMMCASKILRDLCFTKQKTKAKITFARVAHGALVVKMC